MEKSRLTVQDLKRFSNPDEDTIHCPTPSYVANSCMDYYAAVTNYPMIVLDVVSAFVHAHEKEIMTCLEAPDEWKAMQSGMDDLVWQLVQSLYGKRTAGTNFRFLGSNLVLGA